MAKYSAEFKLKVLSTMLENDLSYLEVSRQYGITGKHTVSDWHKIYNDRGHAGFLEAVKNGKKSKLKGKATKLPKSRKNNQNAKKLETEPPSQEERILQLEAEVALLKKLAVLIQQTSG
ncbi:MAG: transposase [Bradymonadales bacterium]